MSDLLKYYQEYHQKGGAYTLGSMGATSRVILFREWLHKCLPHKGSVLDVGCGDMSFAKFIPGFKWHGIDINLDKAQDKEATLVQHDITVTPYPLSCNFDAVTCSEVLEHVWDMRVIHKEVHRLLKPGGFYLVSTPNFDWVDNQIEGHKRIVYYPPNPWTMEHIRHYTPEIHAKCLEVAGFEILDVAGADAHFGEFFKPARVALKALLLGKHKLTEYNDDAMVDYELGRMFPVTSHTIALLGRKK